MLGQATPRRICPSPLDPPVPHSGSAPTALRLHACSRRTRAPPATAPSEKVEEGGDVEEGEEAEEMRRRRWSALVLNLHVCELVL